MIVLSDRLKGVSESITLQLNQLANSLRAQGKDVVNLTTGELDFPVPEAGKKAVLDAVARNLSKYTPVAGVQSLREKVALKTNSQQPGVSAPWTRDNVLITNGGKQALFNTLFSLINPGDEVLVFAPYWLSYPEMVRLTGGTAKIVQTDAAQDFFPTAQQVKSAITSKTKVILLNSPSNPTGGVATLEQMKAIGKVLREHPQGKSIWVITDEIYDRILLADRPFVSFLGANPDFQNQTVTVNGVSKSGAMTGWRLGWAVGPKELIQAMTVVQGQVTSGVGALSQAAAEAVLGIPEKEFDSWRTELRARKEKGFAILSRCPTIQVFEPQGSFYFWIDVSKVLRSKGYSDFKLCEDLLKSQGVAAVPGESFGSNQHIRVSFSVEQESWLKACERMSVFFSS